MNAEFSYALAFSTGLFGAFHCLGMCGGIATSAHIVQSWSNKLTPQLIYHATRILLYTLLGTAGALLGSVLVQSGLFGKIQGVLFIITGTIVTLVGMNILGLLPVKVSRTRSQPVAFDQPGQIRSRFAPLLGGLLNGLVPCSLVFSVAIKAVGTADPVKASLLMLSFGLGTLPMMVFLSAVGTFIGPYAKGVAARLAGISVILLGIWTIREGVVFFNIIKGLAN